MSKLLQVRVDDRIKADADSVFKSLGLDTSTAVRMFLVAAVERRGLPLDVGVREPFNPYDFWYNGEHYRFCRTDTERDALAEAVSIARDPNAKSYASAADLLADCLAEGDE